MAAATMNKHTRIALAESVTHRIMQAIDRCTMLDIEADVLRSVSSVMVDRPPADKVNELRRVMLRAWRRTGDELLDQMTEAQAQLIAYE